MKQLDIDNFSLSRIPRPDDVSKEKINKTIKKIPKPKDWNICQTNIQKNWLWSCFFSLTNGCKSVIYFLLNN